MVIGNFTNRVSDYSNKVLIIKVLISLLFVFTHGK